MDGRTHKYVGICSGIITAEILIGQNITKENLLLGGMLITGSMMGSLIMDIDKKGTKVSKKMPLFSAIIRLFTKHRGITHVPLLWAIITYLMLYWINMMTNKTMFLITSIYCIIAIYCFMKYILKKLKQFRGKYQKLIRGFVSLCTGIAISLIPYNQGIVFMNTFLFCVVIGIIVGIMTHIFLDMLTPMGIPLLWPIYRRRIHIMALSESAGPFICSIFTIMTIISTFIFIIK